jgi:hypothetical protein
LPSNARPARQSLFEERQPARLEGRRTLEKIAGPVNINSSSDAILPAAASPPLSFNHLEQRASNNLRPGRRFTGTLSTATGKEAGSLEFGVSRLI